MQTILIRPDDKNLHTGPPGEWISQFASNLGMVSGRYAGGKSEITLIRPGEKESKPVFGDNSVLVVILHHSWLSDKGYSGFLEKTVSGAREKDSRVIFAKTSGYTGGTVVEKLGIGHAFDFYNSRMEEGGGGLLKEGQPAYWSKMLDMVLDIVQSRMEDAPSIYLSQTVEDMASSRDIIRRELIEHGFRVVPDVDLTSYKKDLKSYVQMNADQSRMVVDLIGNNYGEEEGEENLSISELQISYVSEYLEAIEKDDTLSKQSHISRLIWIDPGFNPTDSRQAEFVVELKRKIEKLFRTEIIQNPLELFKTLIVKRLKDETSVDAVEDPDDLVGKKGIYILHHNSDDKGAAELGSRLSEGGMKVSMLSYNQKQENLLQEHKKNLKYCEAAVIYFNLANRPWLQSRIMDLLKAPGLGRARPMELRHVLVAGDDGLDDFRIPPDFQLTREKDTGRAVTNLLKQLK